MKNTHPLPDKLSELILVALEDLEEAEKSPLYKVDMHIWHDPLSAQCHVCFAGAVIAFGLGESPRSYTTPGAFRGEISDKLISLDDIRGGYLPDGACVGNESRFAVTSYSEDPERWKTEMVLTARALEEIGQ